MSWEEDREKAREKYEKLGDRLYADSAFLSRGERRSIKAERRQIIEQFGPDITRHRPALISKRKHYTLRKPTKANMVTVIVHDPSNREPKIVIPLVVPFLWPRGNAAPLDGERLARSLLVLAEKLRPGILQAVMRESEIG